MILCINRHIKLIIFKTELFICFFNCKTYFSHSLADFIFWWPYFSPLLRPSTLESSLNVRFLSYSHTFQWKIWLAIHSKYILDQTIFYQLYSLLCSKAPSSFTWKPVIVIQFVSILLPLFSCRVHHTTVSIILIISLTMSFFCSKPILAREKF